MLEFYEKTQAWIQDRDVLEEGYKNFEQQCKELYTLVEKYCEWYTGGKTNNSMSPRSIYNALLRGGIRTIDDLKVADEERIASIRNIGTGKRFALIMSMKLSLEQ